MPKGGREIGAAMRVTPGLIITAKSCPALRAFRRARIHTSNSSKLAGAPADVSTPVRLRA